MSQKHIRRKAMAKRRTPLNGCRSGRDQTCRMSTDFCPLRLQFRCGMEMHPRKCQSSLVCPFPQGRKRKYHAPCGCGGRRFFFPSISFSVRRAFFPETEKNSAISRRTGKRALVNGAEPVSGDPAAIDSSFFTHFLPSFLRKILKQIDKVK